MPILGDVRAVYARIESQLTKLGYISSMETKVLHSPFPIPNSPFPIPFSEFRWRSLRCAHTPNSEFPIPHSPFPIPHNLIRGKGSREPKRNKQKLSSYSRFSNIGKWFSEFGKHAPILLFYCEKYASVHSTQLVLRVHDSSTPNTGLMS